MSGATRYRVYLSVAPGLEALLLRELLTLGLSGAHEAGSGGVELAGDQRDLWRVLLCSRLAETVRVRLGRPFRAMSFSQLQQRAERLPWAAFLVRGAPLPRIQVTCHGSRLYHSGAVEQRIAEVLQRRLQAPAAAAEHGGATIYARIVDDQVQLSVDASGERLHRRGYRSHVGAAPLRETLAAACLQAAGYDGARPLLDPFCGAGTICLEAAGISAGRAPGLARSFALEQWPTHDAAGFAGFKSEVVNQPAATATPTAPAAPITGSDVNPRAVAAAEHNAAAAGLEAAVRFRCAGIEALVEAPLEAPPKDSAPLAMIVTNPPFGRRLDSSTAHRGLGALLGRRSDLRPAFALMARRNAAAFRDQTGLRWTSVLSFADGGVGVELLKLAED